MGAVVAAVLSSRTAPTMAFLVWSRQAYFKTETGENDLISIRKFSKLISTILEQFV